ncbi:hypothetical protein [Peromfec virus RodF7_13]|uniref:Uncharacterized protein n=1 Tax=Peromfec virus RodF7_13 TaxID=2929348 RepID=A0A976N2V4_9VIRU|nr:hypothetical protein [Peromfec virus RodF7_13]
MKEIKLEISENMEKWLEEAAAKIDRNKEDVILIMILKEMKKEKDERDKKRKAIDRLIKHQIQNN